MNMKPQDVLVTLKLLASGWPGSYAAMGKQIGLSASETHAALRRARQAGLIHPKDNIPNKSAVSEFLLHGLRYVFPGHRGPKTRGMPTIHAAPPLVAEFRLSSSSDEDVPVWPDPEGEQPGYEFEPLCRSVPLAARNDAGLYEWLVLADALRGGRARERELASGIVRKRLQYEICNTH
ncbi:MAG: hypothetical protein PHN82_04765 [bacterium]|nr:hypothetical protein [bacterium]